MLHKKVWMIILRYYKRRWDSKYYIQWN